MILYLDTSSLIKLFVHEAGSEDVEARAADASVLATSVIAYTPKRMRPWEGGTVRGP